MAYIDLDRGNVFFSGFFLSPEDRKAKRERKAKYKRQLKELDAMTAKDLRDLGYSRAELRHSIREHYING